MNKDRSLLFGMLAVSMKKVRSDKMSAVARRNEGGADFDLGQSLVDEGLLSIEDKHQIDSLVEMSLAEHAGDAARTIQELGKNPDKLATLVDSMDDFMDAFDKNSAKPDFGTDDQIADSILGDFSGPPSLDGDGPMELDSLVEDADPAKTRITQAGNTGDKASIGDIALGDAPDSFFQSMANTGTQIMSPVQAAAEIDESEIVPAVAEHDGRYETIREFAKGGMGQITLVHDTHLGRDIALKQLLQRNILPETRPGAPTTAILTIPIIARFLQEARVTGQLEHPSIIPVYELGYRKDGSLYYTMKLIRGQSMHEVLKDAKDIRERLALLPHFLDLCFAITYAHSRGVIHRDLKPMNIMIGEFGETVLIDWGIAKVQGQDDIHAKGLQETVHAMRVSSAEATAKTMYGQTIGSPYFMPAEQAMGRTDLIDERSDIYSLGAVLYVILTGQMPYAGNNVREFMGKVGQVEPKPVRDMEPQAPPELAAIVKKAMALVPENRYQSAKELTTEIEKFISGGQVSAYDYSMVEIAKRYYKKHKTRINMLAGFAAVLLVLGVYSYIRIREQRDIAEEQRGIAVEQRGIAEEQRGIAVEQKEIAVSERDNAEQQLYYANIANTKFNINEQQMAKARELLAGCKPSLREWEWGFLEAEAHADMLTVQRGGRFAVFAKNDTELVTVTASGTVSRHDLNTGALLKQYVWRAGTGSAVAASGDGSRVAVRGDAALQVWDTGSDEELLHFDEPKNEDSVRHFVAMSDDGKYVAALNSDKAVRVWDVDSREIVTTIEDCLLKGFSMALSPDGSHLLIARSVFGDSGWERGFEVWNVVEGKQLGAYTFPNDSPLSVHVAAFSPDNKQLALGTDNSLWIWSVGDFKEVKEMTGLRFQFLGTLFYSPDGAYLAAGNTDGGLLLYSVSDGTRSDISKAHEDFIREIRFNRAGSRLATVSDDRTVRLWSVPGLRPLHTYRGHDNPVFTVAFNQDDTGMVSSSSSGTNSGESKVWDLSADLEFAPVELDTFAKTVYDRASGLVAGATQNTVLVWDAKSGHRIYELAAPGEASKALGFNPSGTQIASVVWQANAEVLRVWDLGTGEQKFEFPTGQTNTHDVHFINEDAEILVFTGPDLIRFDTSGQPGASVFAGNAATEGKALSGYEISPDGGRLVAGFMGKDNIGTALFLPLAGDGVAASIDIEKVTKVAPHFSPDSNRILICQTDRLSKDLAGSISYWNLADNTRGVSRTRHGNSIHAVCYSRDGKVLATAGDDSVVALWDADTLEEGKLLRGHSNQIHHVDFSPNGKRLVTGSLDRTFKLWDVEKGIQLLTVNDAAVTADLQVALPEQVTFSEDGLQLATITSPPVSPMILHAFSTNMEDYPEADTVPEDSETSPEADVTAAPETGEAAAGDGGAEAKSPLELFEERMEGYKRQYWRQP